MRSKNAVSTVFIVKKFIYEVYTHKKGFKSIIMGRICPNMTYLSRINLI